jgi:hypothetical protein
VKTIKYSLYLLLVLFLFTLIIITTNAETIQIPFDENEIGTTKTIKIPDGYDFKELKIIGYEFEKTPKDMPLATFSTYSEENIDENESVYYKTYYYNILKKRHETFLKVFVPERSYEESYEIYAKSYDFEIKLSKKDNEQTFIPFQTIEYLIITSEALYDTFNDYFIDLKIATDYKINNILIINVSEIISYDFTWVNGQYGDATNASNGNHWIPEGKEVKNNFELFNDTQAKIRNYIRYAVDTYDVSYVLLAGGKDIIPPRIMTMYAHSGPNGTWYNQTRASDMYYSCLDFSFDNNTNGLWGEDHLDFDWVQTPVWDEIDWGYDIVLGRVLVNTENQALNWINKWSSYVLSNNPDYLLNAIVAAEDPDYNIDDYVWTRIGDEFPVNITFLNGQNISRAQWNILYDYCNGIMPGWDGFSFIYHSGHAGTYSGPLWNSYKPSLLNNSEKPNFLYSEGCHHGNFGATSSCINDWMTDDGGIFSGIVNSAYGWFIASTWYSEEMIGMMFNETYGYLERCFAKAHNDARENIGVGWHPVCPMIVKETNFFGDPALDFNFPLSNQKVIFKTPNPANESINQSLELEWNIIIEDPDGDLFDWTIECSNGQSNSSNDDTNGTKTLLLSGLDYDTQYTVWVNATDGYDITSEWFLFTTEEFKPELPKNNSYIGVYDVSLSYFVELESNVSFYWGNHTFIGEDLNIPSYTYASLSLPDVLSPGWLDHDTIYYWYVNVTSNESSYLSGLYNFNTCKAWDLNADGKVNALDASMLVSSYGKTCLPGEFPTDVNNDGKIDALDLSNLVTHYGEEYI